MQHSHVDLSAAQVQEQVIPGADEEQPTAEGAESDLHQLHTSQVRSGQVQCYGAPQCYKKSATGREEER